MAKPLINILLSMLALSLCLLDVHCQVLITEVQATPPAGEPEWIELENISSKTVHLRGWRICDARSCVVIDGDGNTSILAMMSHERVVLTRSVEALLECRMIPSNVAVIEVELPSLNNSTETIVLRSADSATVDSMQYSMKSFIKGRSIERTGLGYGNSITYESVWRECVASDSSTCGTMNAAIRLPRDLRTAELRINDASVTVVVVNHGVQTMQPCTVELVASKAGKSKTLRSRVPTLLSTEEYAWEIALGELNWPEWQGEANVVAIIEVHDDRTSNDTMRTTVILPPSPGTIVFTEVMYDPWEPMKDYVEVYNASDTAIDITSWTVEDASARRSTVATLSTIDRHCYAVITATMDVTGMMDSGSVALCKPTPDWNVEGDVVVLRNISGFVVDAFSYDRTWHVPDLPSTKGVSLEKYDQQLLSQSSASWTSSAALRGGTPGSSNSVVRNVHAQGKLSASPSPFSSDRTSSKHPTIIAWEIPFRHAIATVCVYTTEGRLVRWLINSALVGNKGGVAWDGLDQNNQPVPPGAYVAALESVDLGSTKTQNARCVVVVGN